jgi:pSer/pThr/pTyr-binding forkhead associated (FHA) protein
MPLLRSGADRCTLRPGTNTLGGRGQDALPVPALAWQPAVATITVQPQGPVLIQRTTASVVVRLNDQPLGVGPAELHHGAHIDFAGCRLTYDAELPAAPAATGTGEGVSTAQIAVSTSGARPSVAPGAQLLHLSSGRVFTLPGHRIAVGRDDACDLRLDGEGVSRRHFSIAPVPGGYLLTDESSNGTLVNGTRVGRTHILDDGDIVRAHDDELRFELLVPERERAASPDNPSRAATAVLDLSRLRAGELSGDERRAALRPSPTASLEIIRGPFTGASFHIARPVCSIGRGEQSDVRLRDESVSSTHATLLRKGNTWYVVDLRSVNGTFVDGYRIAGERELPTGATLRVGAVELMFRSFSNGAEDPMPRRERTGLLAWLAQQWRAMRKDSPGDAER